MKAKIYLLTGLLFISASSQAAFHCTVDVKKVLVYNSGTINVLHSGRNDYTVICNLKTEAKGVSIPTCAMWTSMLQNIKKAKAKAIFYYPGEGTCASLPTYGNAPIPVYIGDV
jgi:hypothetical protein